MADYRNAAISLLLFLFCSPSFAIDIGFDERAITFNGERKIIISGSIHYPRSTPDMWPSLIQKAKDGGLDTIETYVFWNAHEPLRRQYDFTGHLDLVRFVKEIQKAGMNCILRIGPYVCAEWDFGGLPMWLESLPNIQLRTNNDVFKEEMQAFVTYIVEMMKNGNFFAPQGGPIILAQIENEYGNVMWAYGDDGKDYIKWCADLAQSYKIGIPWLMCQQRDAPWPMLKACNDHYCDSEITNEAYKNQPKIWTENWTGWFKDWGSVDHHRTAEDTAFAVARFYQRGGTVQNYYMYHGGTNFGKSAGGPYITTSYDYDAPLDEYGNLNQPKWGHLKQLHLVLKSIEKLLTYGNSTTIDYDDHRQATTFSYQGERACFLSNWHDKEDYTANYEGNNFVVPSWSVVILENCTKEIYNTAKVNVQTSIMVKQGGDAGALEWKWRAEHALHPDENGLVKGGKIVANQLLDQKIATNGTSDYLWVMTMLDYNKTDPIFGKKSGNDIILHVHTDGQVIHAFLNGKAVGTQWGNGDFVLENKIRMKEGKNRLSLLSATVGSKNYGDHYEQQRMGIHGPVKLIARKNGKDVAINDISASRWVYKTGLNGEDLGLNQVKPRHYHQFYTDKRPANRPLVWYKTSFKAPGGSDPVVVDLMGLGKGVAWVNGFSIGRYWPTRLAPKDQCDATCDYRGDYRNHKKCRTNCGNPVQRWYHVPRYILNSNDNDLVLFEEFGGTPDNIKIQTVTVGTVCANPYEGSTLELSCQRGKKFSDIKFASFGLPEGTCGSFTKGDCDAPNTLQVVKEQCLGKQSCSLLVSEETFGQVGCKADQHRLAVEACC